MQEGLWNCGIAGEYCRGVLFLFLFLLILLAAPQVLKSPKELKRAQKSPKEPKSAQEQKGMVCQNATASGRTGKGGSVNRDPTAGKSS